MNRRDVLVGAGVLLAGCNGGGSDGTATAGIPEFDGPTEEDATDVDVQWREWSASEVRDRKASATEVAYADLRRNVDRYAGETVHFARAEVTQVLGTKQDDAFVVGLVLDRGVPEILFGSWVGDARPAVRGDVVEVWGYVLGTERYRAASGTARTVPALSLVDLTVVEPASRGTESEA